MRGREKGVSGSLAHCLTGSKEALEIGDPASLHRVSVLSGCLRNFAQCLTQLLFPTDAVGWGSAGAFVGSLWLKASKVCSQGVAGGRPTSTLSPVALGGFGSLCPGPLRRAAGRAPWWHPGLGQPAVLIRSPSLSPAHTLGWRATEGRVGGLQVARKQHL